MNMLSLSKFEENDKQKLARIFYAKQTVNRQINYLHERSFAVAYKMSN